MSKQKWKVGIIVLMLMLTTMASSADQGKLTQQQEQAPFTGSNLVGEFGAQAVIALPQMAYGKYGPIVLNSPGNMYKTICYGGSFTGTGVPSIVVSLEVPYDDHAPYWAGWGSRYSLGMDKGYISNSCFDTRITNEWGNLTGAMIDWHAMK